MRSRLALSILEKSYLRLFFRSEISYADCFSNFIQWNQNFRTFSPRNYSCNGREDLPGKSAGGRLNGDTADTRNSVMRQAVCITGEGEIEESEEFVFTDKLRRLRDASPDQKFWAEEVLAEYLTLRKNSQRIKYWNVMKFKDNGRSLPTILAHFMHIRSIEIASRTDLDRMLFTAANDTLSSNGLDWTDVEEWAYIVSAEDGDRMATRIAKATRKIPSFVLLLVVYYHKINSVISMEILILHVWDLIHGKRGFQKNSLSSLKKTLVSSRDSPVPQQILGPDKILPQVQFQPNSDTSHPQPQNEGKSIDVQVFIRLTVSLLAQARRIWPASMTNIAQLVSSYAEDFVLKAKCSPQSLTPYLSRTLCDIINTFIVELSHPSKAEPYLLITNNWDAQKTLLKLAAKFKPALVLGINSYRAIIQVFAAHKKSPNETHTMSRRSRNWPPWVVSQHGMDEETSTDELPTRVIAAVTRLKEAGYKGDWFDEALSIIGGQEFDCTPTIQTRRMLPWPQANSLEIDEAETEEDAEDLNPNLWAARIVATRDIQEAWMAFSKFRKQGGIPNQDTFLAMFEKLKYNTLLEQGKRQSSVVPGDGLEVLPVPDNNFSDYYRRHLQPPSLEDLYSDMLRCGVTPQGSCLSFLVRNARTPDDGFRYLRASGLSVEALQTLVASSRSSQPNNVPRIPLNILTDFIYLICRFVPRYVEVSSATDSTEKKTEWTIVQLETPSSFGISLDHPLYLVAYLLNSQKPSYLPPWYSFFKVLGFHNTIISQELIRNPRNDILAWRVLKSAFNDFLGCGLHLNPSGFILICHGFNKYLRATFKVDEDNESEIEDACQLLKSEFNKLKKTSPELNGLPKLYYNLRGVHLHAYVRCLALVKDLPEIVSTVEWMVSNMNELRKISLQENVRSQHKFHRIFIVVRICCEGTSFEGHVRGLVESVPLWGGWPTDEELIEYTSRSQYEIW